MDNLYPKGHKKVINKRGKIALVSILMIILLVVIVINLTSSQTIITSVIKESCVGEPNPYCYTSLSQWESSRNRNLVTAEEIEHVEIQGTWDNPDVNPLSISGWTTDADHYINITTVGAARHNGVWSNSAYRLEYITNGGISGAINIGENYVYIEGLQIKLTAEYGWPTGIGSNGYGGVHILENIITKNGNNSHGNGGAIRISGVPSNMSYYIINNIVYDYGGNNAGISTSGFSNNNIYVYNNVVVNSTIAFSNEWLDNVWKNNLCYDSDTCFTGPSQGSLNNAYDGTANSDVESNGIDLSSYTANQIFVDYNNKNFHLVSGSPLIDAGVDLSSDADYAFSTDIDGDSRESGAWDIGADEEGGVACVDEPLATTCGSWVCGNRFNNCGNPVTCLPGCTLPEVCDVNGQCVSPPSCVDNDGDGYNTTSACGGLSNIDCDDGVTGAGVNPGTAEVCNDLIDNNCDSLTDCSDSSCSSAPNCLTFFQCNDGLDNDGDFLVDYPNDPGCSSSTDDDETGVVQASQCTPGDITITCECGGTTYTDGYCINNIWFDPYYININGGVFNTNNFYYVDMNNINCNDTISRALNSETSPWCTIGRAAWGQLTRPQYYPGPSSSFAAQPGDVVIIKEGTYIAQSASYSRWNNWWNSVNSGTQSQKIVFKAEGYVDLQTAPEHSGYAQGGTLNSIVLANTASSIDDHYRSYTIKIVSGTGEGQLRVIQANESLISYNGITKSALIENPNTMPTPWYVIPDETSQYELRPFGPLIGGDSVDHIVIDGFHIDTSNYGWAGDTGPVIIHDTTGTIIINMIIKGHENHFVENFNGMRVDSSEDIIIYNNNISGIQRFSPHQNAACIMSYHSNNVKIFNNYIFDCDAGIFLKGNYYNQGWTHTNYSVYNNLIQGNMIGIDIYRVADSNVFQNIILNSSSAIKIMSDDAGPYPYNIKILNNVLKDSDTAFYTLAGSLATNITLMNNIVSDSYGIIYSHSGTISDIAKISYDFEHNNYFNYVTFAEIPDGGIYDFNYWINTMLQDNQNPATLSTNPQFENLTTNDFRLSAGSPARNAGVDILDLDNDLDITDPINMGAYITGDEIIGVIDWAVSDGEPQPCPNPHPADEGGCCGVSQAELTVYINRWLSDSTDVTIEEAASAIDAWSTGSC